MIEFKNYFSIFLLFIFENSIYIEDPYRKQNTTQCIMKDEISNRL